MANEISLLLSLAVNKNGAAINLSSQQSKDLSGSKMVNLIQIVGTGAGEAPILGDISSPRLIILRNLDPTNYVTVSLGGGSSVHLLALDFPMVIPMTSLTSTDIEMQADTASCRVQVIAFEA